MTLLSSSSDAHLAAARRGQLADGVPRVLVVEPDEDQRKFVRSTLEAAGYQVRVEPNGARIERVIHDFSPDVAVFNVYFDEPPCGFTMTRILRRSSNLPALLVVHQEHAVSYRSMGLRAGADQLILQPFAAEELVARVRALLRRTSRSDPAVLHVGDLAVDQASGTAARAGAPLDLTQREFELLAELARNRGRVVPKQRLLTVGSGTAWEGTSTLATQVSCLRRKIEAHGPRLIHTAHGVGYVLRT